MYRARGEVARFAADKFARARGGGAAAAAAAAAAGGADDSAEGEVGASAISSFYIATLPALGWKQTSGQSVLTFERDNERLTITLREPRSGDPMRVQFELVVKLASSRLPE